MPGVWPVLHIASLDTPVTNAVSLTISSLHSIHHVEGCLLKASVWLWQRTWPKRTSQACIQVTAAEATLN